MGVAADADVVAVLTEVDREVVEGGDRERHLFLCDVGDCGNGRRVDVLVFAGEQRHWGAGLGRQQRRPNIGAHDRLLTRDRAQLAARDHSGDSTLVNVEVGHFGVAVECGPAGGLGDLAHRGGEQAGSHHARGGNVDAADDGARVNQWEVLGDFGRRDHRRVQVLTQSDVVEALVCVEAFGRVGHFDHADAPELFLVWIRERQLVVVGAALAAERGEEVRAGQRAQAAGRVRGGSVVDVEVALVDDDDIGDPHVGEVVGDAGADDSRSDHDHVGVRVGLPSCSGCHGNSSGTGDRRNGVDHSGTGAAAKNRWRPSNLRPCRRTPPLPMC